MLTKKDYELIARILKEQVDGAAPTHRKIVRGVVFKTAHELALNNPKFNKEKFVAACLPEMTGVTLSPSVRRSYGR
jgi:hypothetical protein